MKRRTRGRLITTGMIGVVAVVAYMLPSSRGRWVETIQPSDAGEFWTMLTAVGTFILAIVAARGLRQIRLVKTDMLNRAHRDSRACAITRAEEFANVIIGIASPVLDSLVTVPVFVKDSSKVQFEDEPAAEVQRAEKWASQLPPGAYGRSILLLNRMEAWAMYFTKRLADSETAFGPCAPFYCRVVVQLYPVLLVLRNQEHSGKYPNLVELYKLWTGVQQSERGRKLLESIMSQLDEVQAQGALVPHRHPTPLGTELDD